MRLPRPPWILIFTFVFLMVSCGAVRCAWERDTDFRGLSRHRSTCKHYQRASTVAAQKRRDRARESTLQNLTSQLSAASISSSTTNPVTVSRYSIISSSSTDGRDSVVSHTFLSLTAQTDPVYEDTPFKSHCLMPTGVLCAT